jgi:hypothetical protein
MIVQTARTRDERWRVYIHDDVRHEASQLRAEVKGLRHQVVAAA